VRCVSESLADFGESIETNDAKDVLREGYS